MSDDFIQQLKQIPVTEILQNIYGIAVNKHGEKLYCKIRSERTASCCIYPNNTWYDFGGSVGGDTITLVQTMEACDRKTAMNKLSEWYNIERKHRQRDNKTLWNYEWARLGIQADRTSKNLNICVLETGEQPNLFADISLYIDNPEQITAFESKYSIPFNDFRSADTVGYHNILKQRVWYPMLKDRDDYYSGLLIDYRLFRQIGDENFARTAVVTCDENLQRASDLNEKCVLLRRAVDDISLLKVPLFNLNPTNDLQGILDGSIQFQTSNLRYYELCKWAKVRGEAVNCVEVSYDDYIVKYTPYDSHLRGIPHSAFYINGLCKICVPHSRLVDTQRIFGDKVLKTTTRFEDFSHKNQYRTTDKKGIKPLTYPEV